MSFKCLHVVCRCVKVSNSTKLLLFQNPRLEQMVFLIKFESNQLF
jgi:hypothetical protein